MRERKFCEVCERNVRHTTLVNYIYVCDKCLYGPGGRRSRSRSRDLAYALGAGLAKSKIINDA